MSKTKYWIGIDPGKTAGAIIVYKDGKILHKQVTPTLGTEIDTKEILKFLAPFRNRNDVHAVMEKLHGMPNQKLSVIWVLGKHYGILEALLIGLQIPYSQVTPQVWQKEMWQGTKVQWKNQKSKGVSKQVKDTKMTSIIALKKLLPTADLTKGTARSHVPHDGVCDATLLAMYGERKGY